MTKGDRFLYVSSDLQEDGYAAFHNQVVEIVDAGLPGSINRLLTCKTDRGNEVLAWAKELQPINVPVPPRPVPLNTEEIASRLTPVGWEALLRSADEELLRAEVRRRRALIEAKQQINSAESELKIAQDHYDRLLKTIEAEGKV